jgi:hypothetical protein
MKVSFLSSPKKTYLGGKREKVSFSPMLAIKFEKRDPFFSHFPSEKQKSKVFAMAGWKFEFQ